MERKICYIISFYLGERRFNVNAFSNDRLCYLKAQLEVLHKYTHSLSNIVFNFNIEPTHYKYLSDAINIIPKRIQNTRIEINIRENYGMSYAAFSDVFAKHLNEYNYYIFNEDDYLIVQDNFDEYLATKLESLPNCGYLCGIVREEAFFKKVRLAGYPGGIVSYECLKKVYDKYNEIPYSKRKDYLNNEMEGQASQSVAIREAGYEIYDIREEYRMQFYAEDDDDLTNKKGKINRYFLWQDKDLFLPMKIYINEPYKWTDKIGADFSRMECDYNSTKYYIY